MGYEFIKELMLSGSAQKAEAKVEVATEGYAEWWNVHVQSIIKNDQTRPDRTWNWVSLVNKSHPLVRFAHWMGQKPMVFCILITDKNGHKFPVGMLLLVEKYVYLPDHSIVAPFTWFLAGAPSSLLKEKLDGRRPRLLSALVDIGVVVSFAQGHEGRLGLHSAPAGGVALLEKYMACGLKKLPPGSKLPISRKRWSLNIREDDSVDNYLYADTDAANTVMKKARGGATT